MQQETKQFPLLLTEKEIRNIAFVIQHYIDHHNPYLELRENIKRAEADIAHYSSVESTDPILQAINAARIKGAETFLESAKAKEHIEEPATFPTYRNVITKMHVLKVEHNLDFGFEEGEKTYYGTQAIETQEIDESA